METGKPSLERFDFSALKEILEAISNRQEWLKVSGSVSIITKDHITKLDSLDLSQKSANLVGDPFSNDTKVIVFEPGAKNSHQDLVQDRAEKTFGESWISYVVAANDNDDKSNKPIYTSAVERLEKIIEKRESLGLDPIVINMSMSTAPLQKSLKDIGEFNQYYGTSLVSFEEPLSQVDRDKIMHKIREESPESADFVNSILRLADRDGVEFINKSNGNGSNAVSLFSLLIKDHKKINTIGSLNKRGEISSTDVANPAEFYRPTVSSFTRDESSPYVTRMLDGEYFSENSLLGREIAPLLISDSDFNQLVSSKTGEDLAEALKGKLLSADQYRKIEPEFIDEDVPDLLKDSESVYYYQVLGYGVSYGSLLFFDDGHGFAEGRYSGQTSGASPLYKPGD
jgi:hypothetical protein